MQGYDTYYTATSAGFPVLAHFRNQAAFANFGAHGLGVCLALSNSDCPLNQFGDAVYYRAQMLQDRFLR